MLRMRAPTGWGLVMLLAIMIPVRVLAVSGHPTSAALMGGMNLIFDDRFEIVPRTAIPLNDTGIAWCATGTLNNRPCPQATHPGQDGDHGRDALARQGQLKKVGAGVAGFDYTKLDAGGNALPIDAESWSCVRDNHTGLTWEVKSADVEALGYMNHTYSWYNPESAVNGGHAGTQDGGVCHEPPCDTHGYATAVNSAALCGTADWRLPTRQELHSLVHLGTTSKMVDLDYFPHVAAARYWTDTPNPGDSGQAWRIDFATGAAFVNDKSEGYRVRLVRGGASAGAALASVNEDACSNSAVLRTTPSTDFTVIGDGSIVHHAATGLEWQRCAIGQTWTGTTCTGSATSTGWQGALNFANAAGPDWRLPNVNELMTIVEACRSPTSINRQIFPGTGPDAYWSSSPDAAAGNRAWYVFFFNGRNLWAQKVGFGGRVRLVRDSK